ncbi:MAG: hypothetical protein HQL74_04135 [Magnetococcales bacterium]|nr:hypothetical protein [Magnetococcales bacterium]
MSKMFIDKSTLGSPYRVSYNAIRNVGDPTLDGHHHDILSLLIHLADLLKKRRWEPSNQEVRVHTIDLFMRIRDSLAQHCEIEENLMRQKGYPLLKEHQEEHDLLLVRLDGFIYHCRRHGHPSFRLVKVLFAFGFWLTSMSRTPNSVIIYWPFHPKSFPHPVNSCRCLELNQ